MSDALPHSAHWGAFQVARDASGGLRITPHPADPDPSPQIQNLIGALDHPLRIRRPAVRRSWLTDGPGPRPRPLDEPFVEVAWDRAAALAGAEFTRVRETRGPEGVYGGSYGWASAGRFHHAQSQVHRFLNVAMGGYVRSVNSYSAGAASMLLPQIIGPFDQISRHTVTWDQIRDDSELILSFGGMALRNSAVGNGGVSAHVEHDSMRAFAGRGGQFHLFGPIRDDLPADCGAVWHPTRPGTDTAVMLAMAHVLITRGLVDTCFVERFTTGFEVFREEVLGHRDGPPKTPEWAEAISGVPATLIAELAHRLAAHRSLIVLSHSMQRSEFGEQPLWAALALAAIAGHIGLPGGGYGYAVGNMGHTARRRVAVEIPTMPQGRNPCPAFIPVARISDMLLHPGEPFDYDGRTLTYPDVSMVVWAGGNPFHHHQDLARLARAFAQPDTIVVLDNVWTASARAADIVLPASMTLERNDFGATRSDPRLIAMKQVATPVGEARSDHEILADIADVMGRRDAFTEGLNVDGWLRRLWRATQDDLAAQGHEAPDFDAFWAKGELTLPLLPDDGGFIARYRADPKAYPLRTPSGRIEIASPTIMAHGLDDCPGYPAWRPHRRPPTAEAPFIVIANAPAGRLHSQLDFGPVSVADKVAGRERVRIHPDDAALLGVMDGDVVRLENTQGACLAGVALFDGLLPGVVQLQTGAWFDPQPDPEGRALAFCAHGNANVLTVDAGTSRLAQGCTGQITVAAIRRLSAPPPPVRAFELPTLIPPSEHEPV